LFHPQVARGRKQVRPQSGPIGLEVVRLPYQTQEAVVRYVFGDLDRPRQPIRKSENCRPVPFVQVNKSRRITSSCHFKQKFVCVSFRQSALVSVGTASYLVLPTNV
jgi:hypothetical protein